MKTYVINLDRAVERWTFFQSMMNPTGIEYERVSGVVGRDLQLPIAEFSAVHWRWLHGKHPNLGQIGCYLSHRKVWQTLLESNAEIAMVCEDDIIPNKNLKSIIDQALREYSNCWDILRLSGFHNARPQQVCRLDDEFSLAINLTRLCGTGCYVVTRHAAEVLLRELNPMKVPIDHAIDREWFYGLKAMAVDPLPVKQNPDELPSSIPAMRKEKLPIWKRYWGVFPYRAYNETNRFVARLRQLSKTRKQIASRSGNSDLNTKTHATRSRTAA
jgi:glycosyl transferase, family 25